MKNLDVNEAIVRHRDLIAQGHNEAALDVLRTAREEFGFDVGLCEAEWILLNNIGRFEDVEIVGRLLIEKAPDHPTGYVALCWSLFQRRMYAETVSESKNLNKIFPQVYDGYFFLIQSLQALGEKDETHLAYSLLSEQIPDRAEGWIGQADFYVAHGNYQQAKEILRRGINSCANEFDQIKRKLIVVSLIEGQSIKDVSAEDLAELVNIASSSDVSSAFLINQLRGRTSTEIRRALLDRFVEMNPNSTHILEESIRENFIDGNLTEASIKIVQMLSLLGNWDERISFLWAEYLIRAERWYDLSRHLHDRQEIFKSCGANFESAQFVFTAIWLCKSRGFESELTYEDIRNVDRRLTTSLAVYIDGDLTKSLDLSLPDWQNKSSKPSFIRIHSFAHQSWMPTIEISRTLEVEQFIMEAFLNSKPFSLIRLADCEGNFLDRNHPTISGATSRREGGGIVVPHVHGEEYENLRNEFIEALREADLIGLSNELSAPINVGGGLCIKYIAEEAVNFSGSFTDHAVHNALGRSGFLEKILAIQMLAGRPVYYVGPHDPKSFKVLTVPAKKIRHIRIPPQVTFFENQIENEGHYPEYFKRVKNSISEIPRNSLVLVSAGVLGKIYCGLAKSVGAFALDIGAVSDHWCGFNTRISAQHDEKFSSGRNFLQDLIS